MDAFAGLIKPIKQRDTSMSQKPIDQEPEFIQESTMIPESAFEFGFENEDESVAIVPEDDGQSGNQTSGSNSNNSNSTSQSQSNNQQTQQPSSGAEKKGVMKYAAHIGGAGVLAVIVAAIFANSGGSGPALSVAKVDAPVAVKEFKSIEDGAVLDVEGAALPGSPAALAAAAELERSLEEKRKKLELAEEELKGPSKSMFNALEAQVKTSETEVVELKSRLEKLEQLEKKILAGQIQISGVNADGSPYVPPVKLSAEEKRQLKVSEKKHKELSKVAMQYSVHIAKNNLAWIKDSNGQIKMFAIGDSIPGVGRITEIDEAKHTVNVGGVLIN